MVATKPHRPSHYHLTHKVYKNRKKEEKKEQNDKAKKGFIIKKGASGAEPSRGGPFSTNFTAPKPIICYFKLLQAAFASRVCAFYLL